MTWIQFLITFVVIVLPAISWVFGKLRDQLEQKRAREAWVRRREEELRTGRPATDAPAPAAAERNPDLEELAARRQEQIRRLREQQARAAGAAGAAGATVARPPNRPPAPRPVAPKPGAARPTPPRPRQPQPGVPYSTGATRPRPQPVRPAPRPRPTPVPEPPPSDVPRRLVEPASDKPSEPKVHALELRQRELAIERQRRLGIKVAAQLPAVTSSTLGRISRDELRRAVILAELIRPPVSLRDDEQE